MPKPTKRLLCESTASALHEAACTTWQQTDSIQPKSCSNEAQKSNVLHITPRLPGSQDDCHHSNLPCWGTSCVPHRHLLDQSPRPRNSQCSYQHCNSKLCLLRR